MNHGGRKRVKIPETKLNNNAGLVAEPKEKKKMENLTRFGRGGRK